MSRAARLTSDIKGLRALRESLRARVRESTIVQTPEFVAQLESLYRGVWRTWCAERSAAAANPATFAGAHGAILAAQMANASNQPNVAMNILVPLTRLRPNWEVAKRELAVASLAWGLAHPEAKVAWAVPVERNEQQRSVSVIICSNRPEYFAPLARQLSELFAFSRLEIIGINDAKSLSEGYNRGAARANGDVLIFCHDDIQLVQRDFGQRLLHHLSTYDIVGVAGTSRLVNGDWTHAGLPHVHGQLIHKQPGESGYSYFCAGLQGPIDDKIQALHGMLIATHRYVWEALHFDEATFDGFHLYDIDFSYRAFLAGYRLGVPLDLLLIHFSTGENDRVWRSYAQRFLKKFARLSNRPNALRRANLHVNVPTLRHLERMHAALLSHRFGSTVSADE